MVTEERKEPAYPDKGLYGIVGANLKKSFDVREVRKKKTFIYMTSKLFLCESLCNHPQRSYSYKSVFDTLLVYLYTW